MEEYPSNSHRQQQSAAAEKATEGKTVLRVVSDGAKVSRQKKPLGVRMKETFIGGDTKSVFSYIVDDVLVPAFRDMITDAVSEGVQRMIYGEKRQGPRRGGNRGGFGGGSNVPINYSRYSSQRPSETRPPSSRSGRREFEQVILDRREEAQNVIDAMRDILDTYEFVSVRDFYEMVGEPFNHVDEKFGWYNLSDARVRIVSGGYLIDLPRPEPRG